MKLIPIFLSCLLAAISCNKSSPSSEEEEPEELPVFSGTFKGENKMSVSLPVMYTKNTIIEDQAAIREYLGRHDLENYFDLDITEKPFGGSGELELRFDGTNKYRFMATGMLPRDTTSTIVSVDDNKIVLQLDSMHQTKVPNTSSCYSKLKLVEEIRPYSNCSMPSNGYQYCDYSAKFPLNRKGSNLELPYVNCAITQGGSGMLICKLGSAGYWNNVNPNLPNELLTTDTIVVQVNKWLFVKQQ